MLAKFPVVGIDLGTTNTVVCVCEGGEIDIIKSVEGSEFLPSIVGFTSAGHMVGSSVKGSISNIQNIICESMRMMGLKYDDVSKFLQYWLFKVVNKNGKSL